MSDFDDAAYRQAVKALKDRTDDASKTEGPAMYYCDEDEPVFYFEGPYAVTPGHIYSAAGVKEYRNPRSHLCEFHFDAFTAFESDVPAAGWAILQEWRKANRVGDFVAEEWPHSDQ